MRVSRIHPTVKTGSSSLPSEVNCSLEHFFLDGDGRDPKIVVHQGITGMVGESVVIINQWAPEPYAFGVFDSIVALLGEAEAVSAPTVFMVHDFGMGIILPPDGGRVSCIIMLVLRDGHNLPTFTTFYQDNDMFPVVTMATSIDYMLDCNIFLEVISVHVGTPIMVAAAADIDIVIIQITRITALIVSSCIVVIKTFGD